MPLYRPTNMQGAASNVVTPLGQAGDFTLLLEWGHFIEETPNLLVVNASVLVDLIDPVDRTIILRLLMDDNVIQEKRERLTVNDFQDNVAFETRLQDVPIGHHVFKLDATSTGSSAFARERGGSSFSGPAVV